MNTPPRATTARGFTLLELLVVIAIVGVIAALVMGALRKARSQGEAAECVNNLRVLAEANLRYAADNGGQYCFAMDKSNRVRWHGVRETLKATFDPKKGPLSPYLGREGRVKICPSFQEMLNGGKSFEEGAGGYGYNAVYIGGSPANRWEGERVSNIENPTRTMMFSDTAMARRDGVQEYPFAEPWEWVNARGGLGGIMAPSVHFRHNGKANVAWCDGHVSAEKPTSLGGPNYYGGNNAQERIGWFGPQDENGYWNPQRKRRD